MTNLKELESDLNVEFEDPTLLKQALTHSSYLNESQEAEKHNERLEFLGDAVLEVIITDYLFRELPDSPEGTLTAARAEIVRTRSLSDAAQSANLEPHLRLSKGERQNSGSARDNILANTFEAVIGAIYLDKGLEPAKCLVLDTLQDKIDTTLKNKNFIDPKSELQEIIQNSQQITPHYEVLNSEGPDHNKTFTVGVFADDELLAKGQGPSKQSAETEAAKQALEQI